MISIFFKLHFSRLKPKVITCRNYNKFHEEKFLNDLKETNIIMNEKDPSQNYQSLTKTFFINYKQTRFFKKENCARKSGPLYD